MTTGGTSLRLVDDVVGQARRLDHVELRRGRCVRRESPWARARGRRPATAAPLRPPARTLGSGATSRRWLRLWFGRNLEDDWLGLGHRLRGYRLRLGFLGDHDLGLGFRLWLDLRERCELGHRLERLGLGRGRGAASAATGSGVTGRLRDGLGLDDRERRLDRERLDAAAGSSGTGSITMGSKAAGSTGTGSEPRSARARGRTRPGPRARVTHRCAARTRRRTAAAQVRAVSRARSSAARPRAAARAVVVRAARGG